MALVTLSYSALQALRDGRPFLRIKRTVADADWYNLDVAPSAIAIGPDSDIDVVAADYFDLNGTNLKATAQISVAAPFTSRLECNMGAVLSGSSNPARINLGIGASGRPRYVNTDYFTPTIDLLVYFGEPQNSLPVCRAPYIANSTFTFAAGVAEQTIATIPYYGRRKCTMTIYNRDAAKTLTAWRLVGLKFISPSLTIEHVISPASGSTNTLAALGTASYVLSEAGFDGLRLYGTQSASGVVLSVAFETND